MLGSGEGQGQRRQRRGHGWGSRGWSQGAVGVSGGKFEMKRKCS